VTNLGHASAQNLIFDLGGVILDIELHRAMKAFAILGQCDADALQARFWRSALFFDHETGRCGDAVFRRGVCELLQKDIPDAEIDRAWNALLLAFPAERIALLQQLRKHYRLYLLSNTNAIHIRAVNQLLHQQHGIANLTELFDKVYYSYEVGKRKPDPALYTHVLADAGITAAETVFFDDLPVNLQGADQTGLCTVLIRPGAFTITDYFQWNPPVSAVK